MALPEQKQNLVHIQNRGFVWNILISIVTFQFPGMLYLSKSAPPQVFLTTFNAILICHIQEVAFLSMGQLAQKKRSDEPEKKKPGGLIRCSGNCSFSSRPVP